MLKRDSPKSSSRDIRLWLVFVICCIPFATAATEHGTDHQRVADMDLASLMEVPVTVASLAAESFREAPSSVTVFTRREIRNMGILTVEDLLNYVPGMQSARTASRSSYAISARGRNSSQLSNDILFLLNGQRLNDDFSGAAILFNRFLSTGNVAQVEIIRGPGSALYGSNAFLGVVNIVTADGQNEAALAVGSHQGIDGHVALSGGNDRYNASVYVSGLTNDGEKFFDPSSAVPATTRDPEQAFSLYATLKTGKLLVEARHAQFAVDDFYVFGVTPANNANEYHAEDSSLRVTYQIARSDARKLKFSGGVRRIDNDGLGEPPIIVGDPSRRLTMEEVTGVPDAPAFMGGSLVRLTEWDFSLDGSLRLDSRHHLFGGFEYRYTHFDTLRNQNNYETTDFIDLLILADPPPSPPIPITFYGDVIATSNFGPQGESRRILGAFVQDKVELRDDLHATLGVRFDHYSDFGSATNPRAALVYQSSEHTVFKLMYGQAFRAPTVLELSSINSPRSIGNENLRPEKIRTLELAWLQEVGPYQFTFTGYRNWISNQIVRRVLDRATDPRATWINSGSTDLSGVELELQAFITPRLSVRGSYAHGFEVADNPQSHPRNQGAVAFNYRHGRWNANLNMTYRGSIDTASTILPQRLDGAWTANLHLRYKLQDLTLLGGISNITDDDTGEFTGAPIPGGSPVRGRTFRLGMEIPLGL